MKHNNREVIYILSNRMGESDSKELTDIRGYAQYAVLNSLEAVKKGSNEDKMLNEEERAIYLEGCRYMIEVSQGLLASQVFSEYINSLILEEQEAENG